LTAITRDHKEGLVKNADDLLRRFPSEAFNFVTGIAGLFMASSAIRYKLLSKPGAHMDLAGIRKQRLSGWMDLGLGTMTTGSAAIPIGVKEKKWDPDEPHGKGLQRVWEWVQEKPLRVAGYGYMMSTLCHAAATVIDYKEAKRLNDTKRIAS